MLYLVRHGEAVTDREDTRRPLSAEGRRQMESIAGKLRDIGAAPKRILHSGKLRAQQTAEILADALGQPGAIELRGIAGLLPDDDPKSAAELAAATGDEDLMLVGHLPHLGLLAGVLTRLSITFHTANVVCLQRGDPAWRVVWIKRP